MKEEKDFLHEPQASLSPLFLQIFFTLAQFRIPMKVNEIMVFPTTSFYVCPRCKVTLDREFVSFCDRCGQMLDWSDYLHAKIIYPSSHNEGKKS